MVMTKRLGRIGAIGSGSARLFHPGDRVQEKYPPDTRMRCVDVVITSEAQKRIRNKTHLCYLVSIPNVDGECYIIKKNFRVDVSPEMPFESKRQEPIVPPPVAPRRNPDATDHAALHDIVPNVRAGSTGIDEHIAELRAEGIDVDDDNEALDEGGNPPPLDEPVQHTFVTPTHCPRRSLNITDDRGRWAYHRWDQIADYSELELFQMAFPEEYVETVLLPATNENLRENLKLGEFYKWLGCNFFMACFQGIADRECWWSSKAVSMFEGAPFRLNNVMPLKRYREITAAMRFTNVPAPKIESDGFEDWFHEVCMLSPVLAKLF